MNGLLIVIVIAAAVVVGALILIKLGSTERSAAAAKLAAINSIDIQKAKQRAYEQLSDVTKFRCVGRSEQAEVPTFVAPMLKELFGRYDRIESLSGERAWISRFAIESGDEDFKTIGRGLEASDLEYRLGIRSDDETIFVLYPNEPVDLKFGQFTTVFHWILAVSPDR